MEIVQKTDVQGVWGSVDRNMGAKTVSDLLPAVFGWILIYFVHYALEILTD